MVTTYRKLIEHEFMYTGDAWNDVVYNTIADSEMDEEFDNCVDVENGHPFILKTRDYVYYPSVYGVAEGVAWSRRMYGDSSSHAMPVP